MEAIVSSYGLIGKPASFAVKIFDKYGNLHKRVVPLELKSKYQAELAAIKYVCYALPNKDINLLIKTSISHIPQIFVKTKNGEWIKRKKTNDLVDEIRALSEQFKSFKCVFDDSEEMDEVKAMAKLAK